MDVCVCMYVCMYVCTCPPGPELLAQADEHLVGLKARVAAAFGECNMYNMIHAYIHT